MEKSTFYQFKCWKCVNKPAEILILDEPTAGLNPKAHQDILDMVCRIHCREEDEQIQIQWVLIRDAVYGVLIVSVFRSHIEQDCDQRSPIHIYVKFPVNEAAVSHLLRCLNVHSGYIIYSQKLITAAIPQMIVPL